MVRLAISVEGPTEERFTKTLLEPHLQDHQVYVFPFSLGGNGGNVSLPRIRKDLNEYASNFDRVTTLYDFYGFKGKAPNDTKQSLECKILDAVAAPLKAKVIPYIQMHEFEGLLFSSPQAMAAVLPGRNIIHWAEKILAECGGNPEDINDSEQTAPSKRLEKERGYRKASHGPAIAKQAGLDAIRQQCAGFNTWLTQLESLKPA